MAIYIYIDNKPLGPFEEVRILEWLAAGKLSYEDLAIRHGGAEWTTLGEMFPSMSVPHDAMPAMPRAQMPPPMPPGMLPGMQPVMPPPIPLPVTPPVIQQVTPPVAPPEPPVVMQSPLQENLSGNGFSATDVAPGPVETKTDATAPEPEKDDYTSLIVILGLTGLFVVAVIGLAGILAFILRPQKTDPVIISNTNTNSSNSIPDKKATSFKALTDKSEELAKLTPPLRLENKPVLKEKIALVRQSDTRSENSINMQGYRPDNETYDELDLKNFGLTPERLAKTPEEIDTLIQTLCSKGRKIGTYSSRYGLIPAYSNVCKVSIIDYKESKIIAQKSFENRKLQDITTVYPNTTEDVAAIPYTEIEKYISDLSKNRK